MTKKKAARKGRKKQKWLLYSCSYPYGGSQWGFTIKAVSLADARRRMVAIRRYGRVDGFAIEMKGGAVIAMKGK